MPAGEARDRPVFAHPRAAEQQRGDARRHRHLRGQLPRVDVAHRERPARCAARGVAQGVVQAAQVARASRAQPVAEQRQRLVALQPLARTVVQVQRVAVVGDQHDAAVHFVQRARAGSAPIDGPVGALSNLASGTAFGHVAAGAGGIMSGIVDCS